jgi:hypothetical protein
MMKRTRRQFPSAWSLGLRSLCDDRRGTIAVMTGLCAVALAGFTALAVDGNATGTDVTFFIQSGNTASINGGGTTNFTAPISGTYSGIAFFGDRAGDTISTSTFNGGSNMTITGAVYFPTQSIAYSGGSVSGPNCTQLVVDKITVTGNAYFSSTCQNDGMANINAHDGSPGTVQAVE